MPPKADLVRAFKTFKKVIGSKGYAEAGQATWDLPKTGVVKKIILRFTGTVAGSAFSATAQPRSTARALGFVSFSGARTGHQGFQMKRTPAHMLQLRERILYGVNSVETAIGAAAGAFSLQLSVSLMDPKIVDRGQMSVSGLDLANYGNPKLQLDFGNLISTSGDNDNIALVGSATAPAITGGMVTLTLEMADLPHNVGFMDNVFEYVKDTGTSAATFTDQVLKDPGLRMYDIIETAGMDASGIETPLNAVPADQSSVISVKAGINPVSDIYGPDLQEDELKSFFKGLTTPPTGLYILDHANGVIGGQTWREKYGDEVQYLNVENATAASLSTTTLKMRVLHCTLNP